MLLTTIPVFAVPLTLITLIQTGTVQLPGFQAPSFDWFEKLVTPTPEPIDTANITYPTADVGLLILESIPGPMGEQIQGMTDELNDALADMDTSKVPPQEAEQLYKEVHRVKGEIFTLASQSYNAEYGKRPWPTQEQVNAVRPQVDSLINRIPR